MKRSFWAVTFLAGAALVLGAPGARADVFDFTLSHCSSSCGASPFGSVTLTQVGTSVDVSVALFNGNEFVQTGAGDDFAFKFDASQPAITNADITVTSSGTWSVAGPGSEDGDGTGDFTYGLECTSCGTGGSNAFAGPITFTVSNATLAELEIANSDGNFFVADILGNGNTGPVAATGQVEGVPGPVAGAGLPGLIAACGGLLFLARRRRGQLVA